MLNETVRLARAIEALIDVVQQMAPGLNDGEYEKGLLVDRLEEIRDRLPR